MSHCLQQAIGVVHGGHRKFGISIDVDAFDPVAWAPGTGVPEPDGLDYAQFRAALTQLPLHDCVLVEITEFNPLLDDHDRTLRLVVDLVKTLARLSEMKTTAVKQTNNYRMYAEM